jgi:hypothetical protein
MALMSGKLRLVDCDKLKFVEQVNCALVTPADSC